MADEIKGLVTDLKLLVEQLDEVAKTADGAKLVLDFLSQGTGNKEVAKEMRTIYEGNPLDAHSISQANDTLRDHRELLQEIIRLRGRVTTSAAAPATTSAEVVTLTNANGFPALSTNREQSVAVLSSASQEALELNSNFSQDSLGYLHDQVKNVVIAAVADGVGSVQTSKVASSIMRDIALSIPHDQPFTRETILQQAEQVTPQMYAQKFTELYPEHSPSERKPGSNITGFDSLYDEMAKAAQDATMSWKDFFDFLSKSSNGSVKRLANELQTIGNTTLSAYRRRYDEESKEYVHEVVQLGDSPIHAPALGLRAEDVNEGWAAPVQIAFRSKGVSRDNTEGTKQNRDVQVRTKTPVPIILASDALERSDYSNGQTFLRNIATNGQLNQNLTKSIMQYIDSSISERAEMRKGRRAPVRDDDLSLIMISDSPLQGEGHTQFDTSITERFPSTKKPHQPVVPIQEQRRRLAASTSAPKAVVIDASGAEIPITPVTTPTTTAGVTTLGSINKALPTLSMNREGSIAMFSSASTENLNYGASTQDSLGYLHDQVKNVVIAAVADGVGSVEISEVASSIMRDVALSIPHDQPFTRETILQQAEQVTPQMYAQKFTELHPELSPSERKPDLSNHGYNTFYDDMSIAAQDATMSWKDFFDFLSKSSSRVAQQAANELQTIGNTTLSAYRRKYDEESKEYVHEVVQLGDSPIHAPALGLRAQDVAEDPVPGTNAPVQLSFTPSGLVLKRAEYVTNQNRDVQTRTQKPVPVMLTSDAFEQSDTSSGTAFSRGLGSRGKVNEKLLDEIRQYFSASYETQYQLRENQEAPVRNDDASLIMISDSPLQGERHTQFDTRSLDEYSTKEKLHQPVVPIQEQRRRLAASTSTPKAVIIDASGAEIPITPVTTPTTTATSAVEPEPAKPVVFTPARPIVPTSKPKAATPPSRPPSEPPKPPSKPPAPPPEHYGGDDDYEYRLIEGRLPKRRDIGNRPKGVNTVDDIIDYVINNRSRFDTAGDVYTPETTQRIQNLLQLIDSGDASKEAQSGIAWNFRKLFPVAATRQMQGKTRGSILSTVSSAIQHLGLTKTAAAQNLHTTSDQYVLSLLNDLVEKVAIVDSKTDTIHAVSVDKDLIRSKVDVVARGLRHIVRRAVAHPTVTAVDAANHTIEDLTDNFHKVYDDLSSSTNDDGTTNDSYSLNVFRPMGNVGGGPAFVNRRGLGGSQGRQSFRQALKGPAASDRARVEGQDYNYGSQVVGYQSAVVFPELGIDKSIEAQIKAQRERVNQEIVAGKMIEVTVGNRRVRMPESLARSRVAAARAASAMSQDTSLVGRRGSDEGPIGVYGSNSLYQSTLDLHKAALIQQYLTNPDTQIDSFVDETFMQQVISQKDIEEEQNTARLYGQRAIEQLQYRERQALLRHVTGSTVEERRQGYDEAFAAAQQREFLQKLMHEATTPQERGELLGIQRRDAKDKLIAGQFADVTANQAMSYIFGERLTTVPDFKDASINIINYAGELNEQLAEQGIAAPSRNYTTSSVMKRILGLFQTGVTEDDRRRLIDGKQSYEDQMNLVGTPHTRVYNGQARNMSGAGMTEKELFDVIGDFFGLSSQDDRSMFSSIYHAGRIATEEGTLQPADVIAQAYGGDVRMPLSAVFSGAEDFRNLSGMGMPIVDYARLASKTDRTRQEEETLALAQERMPILATLGRGELSQLAEVDLQKDPKQVMNQIISIIGKRIQAEIEKAIRKRAIEAGKTEAEIKLLFDENKRTGRVEEGFQPFFRAFNFFDADSFNSNPEINRALKLIASVAEEQDKGQTELGFMSKATGVAIPTIAPSAPVPSTRYPVAELGREMAVAEAGRAGGASVTAVRKSMSEGEEYPGNLKRAYYLRYALASGTEAEKAKAAQEIALLRSVAAARGKSPDQWEQYGFVSLDEGFEGRTNTERAKQFLNYKVAEEKAATGDMVARHNFDLLEQARQAVIQARSGDEERYGRPNIPVLVDANRPVSNSLRDVFANTIFGRFINEAGRSQRVSKGGEDAEFESVLGLDQVRLPENELSKRIAQNPQEAVDLYNSTNSLVQRFYQNNVSPVGAKVRTDNVNYTNIKRIRNKLAQLSAKLEKTADPAQREKIRTQIGQQERLLVKAEARLDRLLKTVIERELKVNSIAANAGDVFANQSFIGSIVNLNRQARSFDEENTELYPTQTQDLPAESMARLAETVASVAAGDLVEPVTMNSELTPESAQLVQTQLDQMIAGAETRQITVSPLSDKARNRHLDRVRSLRAKQQSVEAEGGQLTLSEKQQLNTSLGKLRQDAIAKMRQKMPDDFEGVVGLPQLSDLAYQLSSSEKTQNRADMLIAAVEAMSPEERIKASGIDFTDPYSRRNLAEQSGVWDQVLQLIPLGDADIAEAIRYMRPVSIADEATYTKGKSQRSAQKSVGQASADRAGIAATRKAKAAVAVEASDQGPMFFDLETNIPELDALNLFLAKKASSNQTILDPVTGKQRTAATIQEYIARKRQQDANYDPLRDPRLAGIIPAYEGKPVDRSIIQAAVAGKEGDPEVFYGLPTGKGNAIRKAIDSGASDEEIRKLFPASVSADVVSSLVTHARTYGTDVLLSQAQIRQRVRDRLNTGNRVVGHNINQFDIPTLGGGVVPETYDTLEEARRMGPRPSFTLGNLYQDAFGKPIQNAHTAGADVVANRELYEMFMSPTQREEFTKRSYDPLNLMPSILGEVNDEARMRRARALLRYARPLSILQQFKKNPTGANAANAFKILGSSVDLSDSTAVQAFITDKVDPVLARHADVDYGAYAGYAKSVGGLRNQGDFGSGISYARLGQDLQTMSFADFMERHARDRRPSIRNAAPDVGTVDLGVSGAVTTASTGGRRTATPAAYGSTGVGSGGVGGGGGMGGGTVFGGGGMGGGSVGPVIIHTDSTTVHSANTHMATTGSVFRPAAPEIDPVPDTNDIFAGAGGGATRSTEGRAVTELDPSSTAMTTIGSANIGNFTSPGATVSINGSTVTINANFDAGAAGALKKSLVYVGAGGTTVSGVASSPAVGSVGYQRRSVVSDMLFSQMDILRSDTQRRLRATTDPMEQAQIQQEAQQEYIRLQKQALILHSAKNAFGAGVVQRNLDYMDQDPLAALGSMTGQVLFDQVNNQYKREAALTDTSLSPTEREAQLTALDENDQELTSFAAMLQRVTQDLHKFDAALKVPYAPSAKSATDSSSPSGYVPSVRTRRYGVLSETELAAKTGLEMARNQYQAFQGALPPMAGGESTRFASMQDLTKRTRLFAASLLKNDIEQPDLTGLSFTTPEDALQADKAATDLQDAINTLSLGIDEKPIEELTSDLMRVQEASTKLRSALTTASDAVTDSGETKKVVRQLDDLNQGVSVAGSQARQTSNVIDAESTKNYKTLEENLQAIVGQQGLMRRVTGQVQREARDALRSHLTGIFGDTEQGRRAIGALTNDAGQVTAYRAGRRRNIIGASRSDLAELQDEVFKQSGMRVSMDELERLQRTMGRVQQTRNQSPFNDTFFYAMSRIRDIQTLGQTVMGLMNLPQTISSTIGQVGDPQLRTERIMTTARALSLNPETYTKALAAATKQQSMFGGTLARNLEDMTSFIPISNTYGVDVGKSVQVARKLAAFDPAQGMQGASIALKEFLSGNVSSLSRRFEINRSELSKINTGDANEMLDNLDKLLAKMGVTDKLIDDQANSLATKYDRMTGRLESLQVQFSAFAVGAMTPLLEPVLGDRSFLARQSLDLNLQKVVNERLKSYGDSVLSNPDTGLRTVDVFSPNFAGQLDPLLAKANEATSLAALDFTSITGNISNVELYRRLGNMSETDRLRIQQQSQLNVLSGMNQEQAILQAMRNVGGDYFSGEEYQAQRRPLGFYGNELNFEERQRLEEQSAINMRFGMGSRGTGGRGGLGRSRAMSGTVERRIDADTFDINFGTSDRPSIRRVRVAGVDAPEHNTPAGMRANEYADTQLAKGASVTVYSLSQDKYSRYLGSIQRNGVDYGTGLVATGNAAVMNYENALDERILAPMRELQQNAANLGMGPINEEAARLGLGANAKISQAVRDQYFRNTYLGTAGLAALAGGGAGYTLGGLATFFGGGVGAAGGTAATQLALQGFGVPALATGASAAGTAAAPAIPFILGAAALAGGGYLGYSAYRDSVDTSSAKQRELERLQSEEDQRKNAEAIANKMYPTGVQQEKDRLGFTANLQIAGAVASTLFGGSFGLLPQVASNAFAYLEIGKREQEIARDEFVTQYVESGKELAKRYNGLAENEKRVYSLIVNDPITGQRSTAFDVEQKFMALNARRENDPVAEKLLTTYASQYTDFGSRIAKTREAANLIATAQEYGIISTFRPQYTGAGAPRDSRYMQPVNRVITTDEFYNLNAAERESVYQQLNEQINTASWKRFAREYADQSMEKQYQMSQQRFTQFVDLNALNAFAGFGAFRGMTNPLVSSQGFGRAEESITDTALRNMSRTDFIEGVKYDKDGQEQLRTAQEAAVKQLTLQTTAYKEQEALTRPFNLMLKSTYSNFIQTLSKSGALYNDLVSYLAQGNPRGFLDLSQQMTGFNVQAIMQNRITTQNAGIMGMTGPTTFGATGPGAVGPSFNFGYTQGPRGTLQYVRDFMKAPELPLFNPATIFSTIMQGVQANTEIVQRNIQFGRQMRDSEINNKRSLEDINRNGMRNLEDIHRNYTRNMLQLAQQAEAGKRLGTASFYTNAIAANIPTNELNRITAAREQGQQKASHFEEADVGGYLKSPEGMQDTELQKAYAEYEAVPWTDYNAKQAAWRKVMDLVGSRRTAAKNRMDSATTTEEKSAATAQYELLTSNPERGISYRKHVDDWANSELDKAQRRQQLTIQRGDLEREGTRLRERQPALQKQLAEARTPEEVKAAKDAIEDNNVAIQKNSDALAQNAREFESVTATTTLWADSWAEAEKNILNNSASTLSGLINNLKDFDLKYAQSLADAYTGFSRAKEDMVRSFTDAATEISSAVPAEFAKALTAITAYQRLTLKAEAYYNNGNVEAARSLTKMADIQLARSLYPNGGKDYEELLTNLQNSRNSLTASGLKKEDLTMGPSGLGAYGEMRGGKGYLRVIMETKETAPSVDTPPSPPSPPSPPGRDGFNQPRD